MLRIFRSARLVRFISVCGPYFMSSFFSYTFVYNNIKKTCVFIFQYLPAIARRGYCDANIDLTEGEKKIISVLKTKFPSATKVEAQDISGQRSHFFFYKSYYIRDVYTNCQLVYTLLVYTSLIIYIDLCKIIDSTFQFLCCLSSLVLNSKKKILQ